MLQQDAFAELEFVMMECAKFLTFSWFSVTKLSLFVLKRQFRFQSARYATALR